MNSRNSRWLIELAGPGDAAQLSAVYNSDDGFGGQIRVKFTREPDPYASLLAEGDDVVIPVVREVSTGRLVGMGACVIRRAWVGGEQIKVGYLTGLKALPEYRRGVPLIPQVYAFLRAHTPDVACYYTTILTANTLARKLLETPRPRMPEYRLVGEYLTHFYRVPPWVRGPAVRPGPVRESSPSELATVSLPAAAAPWELPGPGDAPAAWCQVLDQRATKQYVVAGYEGRYAWLSRLPVHGLGYPRMPKVGVGANFVSLAAIGAARDDEASLMRLLRGIGAAYRDRDFIMVGVTGDQPLARALARMRTITYSSRLYTVHFDERCRMLGSGRIGLDVGLL